MNAREGTAAAPSHRRREPRVPPRRRDRRNSWSPRAANRRRRVLPFAAVSWARRRGALTPLLRKDLPRRAESELPHSSCSSMSRIGGLRRRFQTRSSLELADEASPERACGRTHPRPDERDEAAAFIGGAQLVEPILATPALASRRRHGAKFPAQSHPSQGLTRAEPPAPPRPASGCHLAARAPAISGASARRPTTFRLRPRAPGHTRVLRLASKPMPAAPKAADASTRKWLAVGIVAASIVGVVLLSAVAILAAGDERAETSRLVFSAVLPLLGTWVGTVLAFYFARANFEAATESTLALAGIETATPVSRVMIRESDFVAYDVGTSERLEDVPLADVRDKMRELTPPSRRLRSGTHPVPCSM